MPYATVILNLCSLWLTNGCLAPREVDVRALAKNTPLEVLRLLHVPKLRVARNPAKFYGGGTEGYTDYLLWDRQEVEELELV